MRGVLQDRAHDVTVSVRSLLATVGWGLLLTSAAASGHWPQFRGQPEAPTPPPGDPLEIVVAECARDVYASYTLDTFRVRNGKLVEHWDAAVINPPADQGQRGRGGE